MGRQGFLVKAALFITGVAVVALTPISINNFVQGRLLLGVGSGCVVLLCAINTWNCLRNRYQPLLILFGLVPVVAVFLWFAFEQLGIVGALWSYPAIVTFYFLLPERYAWIANVLLLGVALPESWNTFDGPIAARYTATLIVISVFAAVFVRFITRQQLELEEAAVTDSLTGLFNRALLQNDLEQAQQQSHRTGSPMSLLMIDLDNFKQVNDSHGHHKGDEVLREIGDYLRKHTRAADTVFRYGGEEFLALLYDTSVDAARVVAEKIRVDLEGLRLLPDRQVTASIGIAELGPGETIDSWLKRADDNLYLAKSCGRNRVVA